MSKTLLSFLFTVLFFLVTASQTQAADVAYIPTNEVPWGWYTARATGLVSFLLLYIAIFLGVVSNLPVIRRFFLPLGSFQGHRWISLQALIFALIHPVILLFDKYLNLNVTQLFIPMLSPKYTPQIALGIIGFYFFLIVVLSAYLLRIIPQKIWKTIHFFSIFLYISVFFHIFFLGTDLKEGIARIVFVEANIFLMALLILSSISKMIRTLRNSIN